MKGRKKTQKRQQPMRFKGWFFAEVFLLFFFNVFFLCCGGVKKGNQNRVQPVCFVILHQDFFFRNPCLRRTTCSSLFMNQVFGV